MGVAILERATSSGYDPLNDAPYMNERHLEYFRNVLTDWYENTRSEIIDLESRMQDADPYGSDEIDRASDEINLMRSVHTMRNLLDLLSSIDESLRRISDKTYGYCIKTKKPIGIKRLMAMPNASLCLESQASDDAQFTPEQDNITRIRDSFINISPVEDENTHEEE